MIQRLTSAIFLSLLLAALAPQVLAAVLDLPREVWVALRDDGKPGAGTLADPFDGAGVEKLNALFDRFARDYGDNLTVHFGPGVFEGDHIWEPRTNWKIRGAGMDITIFRTRPNPDSVQAVGFRAGGYTGGPSGFELSDLTVDFNVLSLRRPNRAFISPWGNGYEIAYVHLDKLADWSADATYNRGQMARFAGGEFIALQTCKGKQPSQGEFWTAQRPFRPADLPAWDAARSYALGEAAAKAGAGYLCIAPGKGTDPVADPAHWKAIAPDAPDPSIVTHAAFIHAKPPGGGHRVVRVKALNGNGSWFFGHEGFMIGLGGDDCCIQDCVVDRFRGSYASLIVITFGQHGVVRGCTVRGNNGTMTMAYGGWAVWDAVYEDNFCANVAAANNIDSLRCRNVTYRGNVFLDCSYVGILVNVGNSLVGGHDQYTMPIDGKPIEDFARSSMDGLFIHDNLVQMRDGAPFGAVQTQAEGLRNVQIYNNVLRTTSGRGRARALGVLRAENVSVHDNLCEPGMYCEALPPAAAWYNNLDLLGQPMKDAQGQTIPRRLP
jgi:hypothetical protein